MDLSVFLKEYELVPVAAGLLLLFIIPLGVAITKYHRKEKQIMSEQEVLRRQDLIERGYEPK
jgi:hypothetical protein